MECLYEVRPVRSNVAINHGRYGPRLDTIWIYTYFMKKNLTTPFSTRQTMQKQKFELFFYSDKKLSHVEMHNHDFFEMTIFLSGKVHLSINGKRYTCTRGDIAIIPPGVVHENAIEATENYERFVIWLSKEYIAELSTSADFKKIFEAAQNPPIYVKHFEFALFSTMCQLVGAILEEQVRFGFGSREIQECSLAIMLLWWSRYFFDFTEEVKPDRQNVLINGLLAYIDDHLGEDLSLDSLAAKFFVSKYHLSHLFRSAMGTSIHQYVLKKRLRAASAAVLEGTDLNKAAVDCGFEEYSSFYRAFCREYGMSPSKWRALQMERYAELDARSTKSREEFLQENEENTASTENRNSEDDSSDRGSILDSLPSDAASRI